VFCQDVTRPAVDMPVLLKLQRKVKDLEEEKRSLIGRLDRREDAQREKSKVRSGPWDLRVTVVCCLLKRNSIYCYVVWRMPQNSITLIRISVPL